MSNEEKEAIEDLKLQIQRDKEELPYSQECLAYKMVLLNLINKQEKALDKMAKALDDCNNSELDYIDICEGCIGVNDDCCGKYCVERIKLTIL